MEGLDWLWIICSKTMLGEGGGRGGEGVIITSTDWIGNSWHILDLVFTHKSDELQIFPVSPGASKVTVGRVGLMMIEVLKTEH